MSFYTFTQIKENTILLAKEIINIGGIYITWIVLHFVCSNLYAQYCTPKSVIGFIYSPFAATLLHCKCLRWTTYNAGTSIENMWFMLGTWILKRLIPIPFIGKEKSVEEKQVGEENR